MFDCLKVKYSEDYQKKIQLVLSHKIAIWDVIQTCTRKGSLDSAIKYDAPNDFYQLFNNYPNIRHVFFNGIKAMDTFKKKVGFDEIKTYNKLPSTSPAHAIQYEKKLAAWHNQLIRHCLIKE